ncbi:MAG: folate family ECF transporter S component [Clostridia bacterium]|nr:folate family ECF transporter S component [Clostridia bacterium]
MSKKNNSEYTKAIAILGVLSAVAAVSAGTFPMGLTVRIGEFIKMSPVFVAVALAGSMYGWWAGALVAFVGDVLQSLVAGLGFSPLILAVNVLCGACFGLLLYNTKSVWRIVWSVLLTQFVGGLGLNTLALHVQYGMPIFPTVYWRLMQTAVMTVVEIVVLLFVIRTLELPRRLKKQ